MNQKLFEFAVMFTPLQTKEQHERGEKPKTKLIVPVTSLVAGNEKEAEMAASRAIPAEYEEQLEQITIVVRDF